MVDMTPFFRTANPDREARSADADCTVHHAAA